VTLPATAIPAIFPPSATLVDVRSGERLDVSALCLRVDARASELRDAGIGSGSVAVVAREEPLAYLIDIFALWNAGAMAVAVNPGITAEERANVVAATGAAAILDGSPLPQAKRVDGGPLGLDQPALTLMTSGTTGRPKGIVHTLRSLAARAALNVAAIGPDTMERTLCVLPLHFGHGLIGNVLTPLAAGGTVHLWPKPDLTEMRDFGPLLDREAISFMSSTPTFWNVAMRLSPKPKRALSRVHVGSAPLSIEHWRSMAEWLGTRNIHNMYGMTETANWIGGGSFDDAEAADGHVGRIWGGAFAVLGEDGAIRREGHGEVLIASPTIMTGYLGMERETAEAFVGHWFRTGDTGVLAADGTLRLVGRIKHEINRGGVKIPAEEIDMLLERHPLVAEACAFALPDPVAGEAVGAAVVLRDGGDTEAIKAWCRERCRAEAVPTRLFTLDAIPRNDRGKVVRAEVRDAVLSQGAA
jgi:acyl-CoA synthetase (AMP-forming)/AMP-acid ligase II